MFKYKRWITDVGKDALCLDLNGTGQIQDKSNSLMPETLFIVMGKETDGIIEEFLNVCDVKVYLKLKK